MRVSQIQSHRASVHTVEDPAPPRSASKESAGLADKDGPKLEKRRSQFGKLFGKIQDAAGGDAEDNKKMGVFIDADSMKERLRQNMLKPVYDVANFYHKTGIFQFIARHRLFEATTLVVIALNALWISIDTDYNKAGILLTAEPVFQFAEHFFCSYFAFEWFVRFCAFKRKRDGCKDSWFVFDSTLVFMMVVETWLMTIIMLATGAGSSGGMGNASILRLARLLRLTRMARMARLLRAMPELMILIKGMVSACRSVFFTILLLAILTYIFGIMFAQMMVETYAGDEFFPTVPQSMHTLLVDGTLLDNLRPVVRSLGDESYFYAGLFYFFVLLSALTVLNMLIGVLCEVVCAVAATEKEQLTVSFVHEKIIEVMKHSGLDEDGDGQISKAEFCKILEIPEACRALSEVGVDVFGLVDIVDFIYENKATQNEDDDDEEFEAGSLSFADFMDVVLQFRGSNSATVKDIVDLRKFITNSTKGLEQKLERAFHTGSLRKTHHGRHGQSPTMAEHQWAAHGEQHWQHTEKNTGSICTDAPCQSTNSMEAMPGMDNRRERQRHTQFTVDESWTLTLPPGRPSTPADVDTPTIPPMVAKLARSIEPPSEGSPEMTGSPEGLGLPTKSAMVLASNAHVHSEHVHILDHILQDFLQIELDKLTELWAQQHLDSVALSILNRPSSSTALLEHSMPAQASHFDEGTVPSGGPDLAQTQEMDGLHGELVRLREAIGVGLPPASAARKKLGLAELLHCYRACVIKCLDPFGKKL